MNLHINYTPSVADFDKLCGLLYTEINESSSPLFNIKFIRDYYVQGNL